MPFDDVLATLTDDHVRFVVTGGRAVVFHGYDRPIADLDIVIDSNLKEAALAVISRADLIDIKQRRGRDYDLDDVARLLM